MESQSLSLKEWAANLVGRDWEIFWSNASIEGTNSEGRNATPCSVNEGTSNRNLAAGASCNDDEEDWYDGHVQEIDACNGSERFSFRVRFVGDEFIYTMVLEPAGVRPSMRAWIKRTKAILHNPADPTRGSIEEWEKLLPPDTGTLEDHAHFARQSKSNQMDLVSFAAPEAPPTSALNVVKAQNAPNSTDWKQIAHLSTLLNEQLYLRLRLAPIVDSEAGPSETYVEHLVRCLKCLQGVCLWYHKCWELHKAIFCSTSLCSVTSSSENNTRSSQPAKVDGDYAIKEGLQEGRRLIARLLSVDTSLAGSKRKRPSEIGSFGTRKTKRRRRKKCLIDFIKESERGGATTKPGEDEFLKAEVVRNFVQEIQCNDNRWYTASFGKMMLSVSSNIVAPLLSWRCQVKRLLGDRLEEEDGEEENNSSDEDVQNRNAVILGCTSNSVGTRRMFYTSKEIQLLEGAGNHHVVLRYFDHTKLQHRLRCKLAEIEDYERRCWSIVSEVFCKPHAGKMKHDIINVELRSVRALAPSAHSSLSHVSPFDTTSSVLSPKVLDDAAAIRGWYLNLYRVESRRERGTFIDDLATKASALPAFSHCESPKVDCLFDGEVSRLRSISRASFDHLTRLNRYRSVLKLCDSDALVSVTGVSCALDVLKGNPTLSVAEEWLSVRLDILRWASEAKKLFRKHNIFFEELLVLKEKLNYVLAGQSETRSKLISSIVSNEENDSEISSFVQEETAAFCGTVVSLLNAKYALSCIWKERAGTLVRVLNQHSSQHNIAQKLPAMVDLKRINDLVLEYKNMNIYLPRLRASLKCLLGGAHSWSRELTRFLFDPSTPFVKLLPRLQASRTNRPRGILADPARHLADNVIDLIGWYKQALGVSRLSIPNCVNSLWDGIPGSGDSKSIQTTTSSSGNCLGDSFSKSIYHLIAEGSEVLETFALQTGTFCASPLFVQHLMSKELDSRRPVRVISRAKLESSALGSTLLEHLFCQDGGAPMRLLLLISWQTVVCDFMKEYNINRGTKNAVALASAKDLMSKRPAEPKVEGGIGNERWSAPSTEDERNLIQLILAGGKAEAESVSLLACSKEILRDPFQHVDAIQHRLGKVKELFTLFRAPFVAGGSGLALDRALEQQLDHMSKVFVWLTRTFPYEFLHPVCCDERPSKRMPWEVLVSLKERMPVGLDSMGGCAGIALRVTELFDAASCWQEEITNLTMLSYRGGKRRLEVAGVDAEGALQARVDVKHVRRLAGHPVLRMVDMPREAAVSEILESARAFEVHLHNFLGEDCDGMKSDSAPYPDTQSLLGRSGEFLLFRLTGSPQYQMLLSAVRDICAAAQDVFADTPGKDAFEWIQKAVSWIDALRSAVTRKSRCSAGNGQRLVINETDARELLASGKSFFLEIPDDLRKTLSMHRIFLSTNRVDEKLRVVFKKGGAHHSIGGTAIKWCPVLFDSLREDVARLDLWRRRVQKTATNFQYFSDGLEVTSSDAPRYMDGYSEEVVMLLEEGIESLVVSPNNDAFDSLNELRARLKLKWTESQMVGNADCRFAKIMTGFERRDGVLKEKYDFLDALLSRSSLELERLNSLEVALNRNIEVLNPTLRDICRNRVDKALRSAASNVGLYHLTPTVLSNLFCTRAGEIEHELNTRFLIGAHPCETATHYKERASTLIWLFGDCINAKLCLQVLLGVVGAPELVVMTDKELVGKWEPMLDTLEDNFEDAADTRLKVGTDTIRHLSLDVVDGISTGVGLQRKVEWQTNERPSRKSTSEKPSLVQTSITDAVVTGNSEARRTTTALHVPAPPPSLAVTSASKRTHLSWKGGAKTSARKGKYLKNSSNGDSFLLAVSKPVLKFRVHFHFEDEQQRGVLNGLLQKDLKERGRLRIEEFTNFLSGKLKGVKWAANKLRMGVHSEEDAKKHKKFYKEYESTRRIAMFTIDENSKLFLVTPKFHKAAVKALGTAFHVDTSTYAIILTKVDV